MRIGIQAWGSEGDLRPFLALGHGLSRAGHDVEVVLTDLGSGRDYAPWADRLGIRVRTVATPVLDPDAERAVGQEILAASPPRQARIVVERMFRPAVPAMFEAATALVADRDLVVGHFFHYPVRVAAEAAGVPAVSVTLAPDTIPTSTRPPQGIPDLGRLLNRLAWRMAIGFIDRMLLGDANRLRDAAGLAPAGSVQEVWHAPLLDLVAVSPALCPQPDDWPARHRTTGFLALPDDGAPAERSPDAASPGLEAFLAAGPPPVYVTFGSLTPRPGPALRRLVATLEQAAVRTGCRMVVQGMAGGRGAHEDRAGVLHVERAPHRRIFPRCAAVVSHGGAGTLQTTLAAGVPAVVVPHVADQFFWGARLHRLGVAARPLPARRLTAAALARRIDAVAKDPAMAGRATALGTRMAGENGVQNAVRWIEDAARRAGVGSAG